MKTRWFEFEWLQYDIQFQFISARGSVGLWGALSSSVFSNILAVAPHVQRTSIDRSYAVNHVCLSVSLSLSLLCSFFFSKYRSEVLTLYISYLLYILLNCQNLIPSRTPNRFFGQVNVLSNAWPEFDSYRTLEFFSFSQYCLIAGGPDYYWSIEDNYRRPGLILWYFMISFSVFHR